MAIRYYPNRIYRARVPAIDRVMASRNITGPTSGYNASGSGDLDEVIFSDSDWRINSISFDFAGIVVRTYSAKIIGGRSVVENLNDYMWFGINSETEKRITIPSGFYSGTQLADELKVQLDAVFAPVTFTVAYDLTTGLFTITPVSGTVRYLNVAPRRLSERDSIAGHLIGFEVNAVSAASISSDTPVFGLDMEAAIINQTSGTEEHYHDTIHELSIDQALRIQCTDTESVSYAVGSEKSINGEPSANN